MSAFDCSAWGEPGLMGEQIAEAEAEGDAIVSIGSDGMRWIVNYVEDPDGAQR
jgi:hypothetical protein